MGNLPEEVASRILTEGTQKLERFGAGLIGAEVFNKKVAVHFDLVKKLHVKYAIIAGGIPSQVNDLEAAGIKTFLHTPSMQMLENAINNCTSQRFIFEGTEAGGHVGSLSSMTLWELAVEKIISQNVSKIKKQTLVFAGGISNKYGSAFISGMSACLVAKGAKIGASVATSYLFTREIVETNAIKQLYQDILKERKESVVIALTMGLPTRTALTPYSETVLFNENKWIKDRTDLQERKKKFEVNNLGSLLIAAKAFMPNFKRASEQEPEFIHYDKDEHFKRGNFLTG